MHVAASIFKKKLGSRWVPNANEIDNFIKSEKKRCVCARFST